MVKPAALPGQMTLPGYEAHPALVHVLTPGYQNIDPANYTDLTPAIVDLAAPNLLRQSLIGVGHDGRSSIGFFAGTDRNQTWIAVTPQEFRLLARHIPALARSAINTTLAARKSNPLTDETQAAAERAGVNAVGNRRMAMAKHLRGVVEPRIDMIAKFTEMTHNPTLARGSRASVRARFEGLRTSVFGDMILALGNQRQWSESQADLAIRAITKRLYMQPNAVANFLGMLELADDYYGYKRALILGRIAEANNYTRSH